MLGSRASSASPPTDTVGLEGRTCVCVGQFDVMDHVCVGQCDMTDHVRVCECVCVCGGGDMA